MAGIYIHVPFCRSRCAYCDFYSTTHGPEQRAAYVEALCREIGAPLPVPHIDTQADTVYMGGGTPSQLTATQVCRILNTIAQRFHISPDAEVTIEMNPDDVVAFFAQQAEDKALNTINRVSLGIQSFNDDTLRLLCRRHDAAGAIAAVRHLQQRGFGNISIDLIYGLPGQSLAQWEHDLDTAFALGIQHLSAYALSYEPGTTLWRMREQGLVHEADEELSVDMYQRLCQRAADAGFEHYEISNFARPGFISRHNSSYWTGRPYYGFGPGAFSYDGQQTRWSNDVNLEAYTDHWLRLDPNSATHPEADATRPEANATRTIEHLNATELFDEFVMCGLRTRQGINLELLETRFGAERAAYVRRMATPHLRTNALAIEGRFLHLTQQSLMTSNDIMSDLMAEQ